MDEDLKPCPFCGHEVRVVEKCSWVAGVYTPIYFVQCKKCNCEVDFTEWDETGTPSYKCKYGVITSWNRRAKDD